MKKPRARADDRLVELGLARDRAHAAALLMSGRVYQGHERVDKPGALVQAEPLLVLRPAGSPFVSRGGEKLQGALNAMPMLRAAIAGCSAVDVGAATGGFTDCLLQAGARRVYAVDVGYGQLHERLRADPRVESRERTNARTLTAASFSEPIDLVVVDASFIGLGQLAQALYATLRSGGLLCAMVKPQFEARREEVARTRGVVRDPEVRAAAIAQARDELLQEGFTFVDGCDSTLPGPQGNLEYFLLLRRAA